MVKCLGHFGRSAYDFTDGTAICDEVGKSSGSKTHCVPTQSLAARLVGMRHLDRGVVVDVGQCLISP